MGLNFSEGLLSGKQVCKMTVILVSAKSGMRRTFSVNGRKSNFDENLFSFCRSVRCALLEKLFFLGDPQFCQKRYKLSLQNAFICSAL
jgi:hypothetical protein